MVILLVKLLLKPKQMESSGISNIHVQVLRLVQKLIRISLSNMMIGIMSLILSILLAFAKHMLDDHKFKISIKNYLKRQKRKVSYLFLFSITSNLKSRCYQAYLSIWQQRKGCKILDQPDDMLSICCQDQEMTWIELDSIIFIGCPYESSEDVQHTRYRVDVLSINRAYLQHLVLYGLGPEVQSGRDRCSFWDISASKKKHCGEHMLGIC